MPRHLILLASAVMSFALGCKGCSERTTRPAGSPPAAEAPAMRTQSDEASLQDRLRARNLDRSKEYPKNADGSIACGGDADCFVAQAEKCAPAELKYLLKGGMFGVEQEVEAEYRITGADGARCKASRHITGMAIHMHPKLEEALRNQGKTAGDIEGMRQNAEIMMRTQNPALLECVFDKSEVLGVALDLAENRIDPMPWRKSCEERSSAPPPELVPGPADTPSAPAAPTQAEPH
jgi:hypothetical protein